MKRELSWVDVLVLTPSALIILFFAFAIVDAVYETVSCKSKSFMDTGHGLVCCTKVSCVGYPN